MVKPLSLARGVPAESSGLILHCLSPPPSTMSPIILCSLWFSLRSGSSLRLECISYQTFNTQSGHPHTPFAPIQEVLLYLLRLNEALLWQPGLAWLLLGPRLLTLIFT